MTLSLREGSNAFWQQLSISRHSTEYTPKQTNSEAAGYFCRERMYGKQDLTNHWLRSIQCFIVRVIAHVVSTIAVQIQEAGVEDGTSFLL